MLDNNTLVKITSRGACVCGYVIPELGNLTRRFMPGESKTVPMDELRKLVWTPGGEELLKNNFILDNKEAITELIPNVEPEYFFDEKDVEDLLKYGTIDQLKDALDFAPDGVVSLIKDKAVETRLNDVEKREAILEATDFNVTNAIANKEISQEVEKTPKTRRVQTTEAQEETETPVRRSGSHFSVKVKTQD